MSLILTTNTATSDGAMALNTGANRPYDYKNFTTDTFEVPKNSEIAVQSIKFNKEGNIEVNEMNNQFYVSLGTKQTDFAPNDTTSLAVHTSIDAKAGGKFNRFSIDSLAGEINNAMVKGVCHPDLLPEGFSVGPITTVKRDGDGLFKGFDYKFRSQRSASLTDLKAKLLFSDSLSSVPAAVNGSYNSASHTVTKIATKPCEMIAHGGPVSQVGGGWKTNFSTAGGEWDIGLTRYLDTDDTDHYAQNFGWFEPEGDSYYDYVAKSIGPNASGKYFLKVFHAVLDASSTNPSGIYLEEIDYSHVVADIELFTVSASYNASAMVHLEWEVKNERVALLVENAAGSIKHTLFDGTNASKTRNLKPTGTNTKFLYPKVRISQDTKFITILEAKLQIPINFLYGDNKNGGAIIAGTLAQGENDYDYFNTATFAGTSARGLCSQLDSRYMFDYTGPEKDTSYSQFGLNGSGALFTQGVGSTSYGISLVLTYQLDDDPADEGDYWPTYGANSKDILGFNDDPVVTTASASDSYFETYTSINVPTLVSTNSIFVRLNNFLQRSINGQTNGTSKILYHVPRFDNGGNEFGGLFFEPGERVYIKLYNTEVLRRNDFSVSLVNSDETLAENITGKTIVMFHIRESPS